MKFSTSFSSLLVVILPLLLEAAALPNGFNGGFGGRNPSFGGAGGRFGGNNQNQNQKGAGSQQQGKGNNNANNNANNASSTASSANSTATAAASSSSNNNNAANNNANNNANNANSDSNPQTSLTLDPSVIGQGFAQNGLTGNGTETGEVASLTSTNNFINFCVGQTITNGVQFVTESCNPIPMGQLPAKSNLPSAKFTSPVNGQNFGENQTFTISMNIQGLQTGNFVNADRNFLGAPQQVGSNGQVVGHSHVVVQKINGFTDTTPADPTVFAFFKGLNDAAENGVLSTSVTGGLSSGTYKVSTINTAANHQPVLAPVAQHGSLDDVVYFTVGNAGQDSTFGDASGAAAGGAAAGAASGAAAGAASGAAAGGANNAAAGGANGAAAKGANGANGAAAKGANGANGAAKGANGAAAKGANGAAAKGANGAKQQQQQQGKGRRSFTISRQI